MTRQFLAPVPARQQRVWTGNAAQVAALRLALETEGA